jgi:hypothetical protein
MPTCLLACLVRYLPMCVPACLRAYVPTRAFDPATRAYMPTTCLRAYGLTRAYVPMRAYVPSDVPIYIYDKGTVGFLAVPF